MVTNKNADFKMADLLLQNDADVKQVSADSWMAPAEGANPVSIGFMKRCLHLEADPETRSSYNYAA